MEEKEGTSERVREWIMAIPNLGKLFWKLARDPRVPTKNKILFGAVAAYLVVPFDVIPDWIPGLGQLDDLVLIVVALDVMINRVPEKIITEHWEGDREVLNSIKKGLETATRFVPDRVRRLYS